MKFAIVVVMLAIAGVQSSIVPWPLAAHSWAHGPVLAHHGPVLAHSAVAVHPAGIALAQGPILGHHGIAVAHHAPAAVAVHHAPAAVAVHHAAAPAIALHAAAPAHAVAIAAHHGHDGQYVAKTRGAVHSAPLSGHIASVSSVNVAPAPGTH
ncbi:adult cuticle protein 1-like [Condylostylus longicornis]|uniref:adult cuticle protein 1-like n=1 Tax=Condylostylus longicornis TaxID=2530218 RepID=UPI00244E0EBA|nr:adult cuticle protein 1-like [Condylostylus longicornis]